MINSEYIKSMNCNFERIKLDEAPEEKRYQYCIVSRGGIRGLLPCSVRIINGDAFLYYDITSKQGLSQIFRKKQIGRQWIKDFVWNLQRVSQELNRFLLDRSNVIWYPENIFQDLEDNRWSFLYYPYYKGENGFRNLLEFIIEKLDYSDDALVECVYKIYEQYENYGDDYLAEKIYQDVRSLEDCIVAADENTVLGLDEADKDDRIDVEAAANEEPKVDRIGENEYFDEANWGGSVERRLSQKASSPAKGKRGLLSFLEGSRKKDKEAREKNKRNKHYLMDIGCEHENTEGVAETAEIYQLPNTKSEVGKTVYIEKIAEEQDNRRRIYDSEGKMLCLLEEESVVIGKKRDEADMVIDNSSVSRIHARIYYSDGEYMLEDLNSTNGTFKNGMRLRPYEKRKLVQGDEIKLGSVALMYS